MMTLTDGTEDEASAIPEIETWTNCSLDDDSEDPEMAVETNQDDDDSSTISKCDEIPTNVHSKEQLTSVPKKFLSDDPAVPLLFVDDDGSRYKYALNPMTYCVVFILLIELLERLSFYALQSTELEFLMGVYQPDWSANMTQNQAQMFVSSSAGLGMTAPFLGGIVADGLLGDYWNILFGTSFLYLPGLVLVTLCTFPYLLGDEFDTTALRAGMLWLWPLGMGFIKSVVNVFGAKQYHPRLQSSLVESYYVYFYMAINMGSVLGTLLIPIVAQVNIQIAYTIPTVALALGLVVFVLGSRRYVRAKPRRKALWTSIRILLSPILRCQSIDSNKKSRGGNIDDTTVAGLKNLLAVFPATALILPFMVAYNQIYTAFIAQGLVMRSIGYFDSSSMTNFDPIGVLLGGLVVGKCVYPALNKRGWRIQWTHRFAIGTAFAALAVLWAIGVEYRIHAGLRTNTQLCVFWLAPSYLLIGIGEIFTLAASFDVAFSIAPREQKGLASGINLFVGGAISNYLCVGLSKACEAWFPEHPDDPVQYSQGKVYNYLWLLFGICLGGILLNSLPWVSNWLERVSTRSQKVNTGSGFEESESNKENTSCDSDSTTSVHEK